MDAPAYADSAVVRGSIDKLTLNEQLARMHAKFCGGHPIPSVVEAQPTLRRVVHQPCPVGIERSQPAERDFEPTHEPCSSGEAEILAAIRERRRGNGITAHELGAVGHVNERKARAIVAHLVAVHAEPVCGTPAESFFWPDRWEDVQHTINSLASRRDEITARINGIEAGARHLFGTMPLPGM